MNPTQAIALLENKGWGIQEIAKHTGLHFATVYRIKNGCAPTYDTACRLIDMAKSGKRPPRRKV